MNISCTEAHGDIKIAVTDTGIGMSVVKQARVFQPFNRLGAEMGNIVGTGIGLVISQKLVEGMQGRIGMESVEGAGSTFCLLLPRADKKTGSQAALGQGRAEPR